MELANPKNKCEHVGYTVSHVCTRDAIRVVLVMCDVRSFELVKNMYYVYV